MHCTKLHPRPPWRFRSWNMTLSQASSHLVFISGINAASVSFSPQDSVGRNPPPAEPILNLPIHSRSPEDAGPRFPWTSITVHLCKVSQVGCTVKLHNACNSNFLAEHIPSNICYISCYFKNLHWDLNTKKELGWNKMLCFPVFSCDFDLISPGRISLTNINVNLRWASAQVNTHYYRIITALCLGNPIITSNLIKLIIPLNPFNTLKQLMTTQIKQKNTSQ